MRGYFRWGTIAAIVGGFFWIKRRRQRYINPHTLGRVSDQWFLDRRQDL